MALLFTAIGAGLKALAGSKIGAGILAAGSDVGKGMLVEGGLNLLGGGGQQAPQLEQGGSHKQMASGADFAGDGGGQQGSLLEKHKQQRQGGY